MLKNVCSWEVIKYVTIGISAIESICTLLNGIRNKRIDSFKRHFSIAQ